MMHESRRRVRSRDGERRRIELVTEQHVHRTVGVIFWEVITYSSPSLYVFTQGNMTAIRYNNDVLQPFYYHIYNLMQELFNSKITHLHSYPEE